MAAQFPSEDQQVTDDVAFTIICLRHLFKILSLPEKLHTLGLPNIEALPPFLTSLTACSTVEGREPRMLECLTREMHRARSLYPPRSGGSHAPRAPHLEASFTSRRTTTATSPEIPQVTAPEFTRRGSTTSAAKDKNKKALCYQRLKTPFPEVEQARAAVRVAVEAKRTTKEALNRKRKKLKLEMKQMWDRYDQEE